LEVKLIFYASLKFLGVLTPAASHVLDRYKKGRKELNSFLVAAFTEGELVSISLSDAVFKLILKPTVSA
jgi:hypothetical protein